MALISKFIFTISTFGIQVSCELFVPSIVKGAVAGRFVGISMESVFRSFQFLISSPYCVILGAKGVIPHTGLARFLILVLPDRKRLRHARLYAVVGAAAVLGRVTRMVVSLVVIMFKLTGSLEFIVPTMVATMFANWIGDTISKAGIYGVHIALNGYPFLVNKEEYPTQQS